MGETLRFVDQPTVTAVDRGSLIAYVEDMLLQLAELASTAGETALAASLALTAIQAGSARDALGHGAT